MPLPDNAIDEAANAPLARKLSIYFRLSGPGWLQAAVTLGGGSLAGSLYLGVIGGYEFLWLQPLAMLCGVIMLSVISYVTLSTEERPFRAICNHISPTLAWLWLLATLVADVVFCAAQFALGSAAMTQNLGMSLGSEYTAPAILFVVSLAATSLYLGNKKASAAFDTILKALVGVVILCFFGVAITLAVTGRLEFSVLLKGLIPDFSSLFKPVETLQAQIDMIDPRFSGYWTESIAGAQRDKIIAAFGSAVGINMTFLLPYTLRQRGWTSRHRDLARWDLIFGLFIPFVIATGCLVIVSATLFHQNAEDMLDATGEPYPEARGAYESVLAGRVAFEANLDSENPGDSEAIRQNLTEDERVLAAMVANRDAGKLARALEPLLGDALSKWVFGLGVLAMAVSTMIIHQVMNGYAMSEAFNAIGNRKFFMIGALMPATTGLFSPLLWTGDAKLALAIPAAVIATTLLPVAYLAFALLLNSRQTLGSEIPRGRMRIVVNALVFLATGIAFFAAGWILVGQGLPGMIGLAGFIVLSVVAVYGFYSRQRGADELARS